MPSRRVYSGSESAAAMNPAMICPRCASSVKAMWLICPHCEAVLQGPERGSRGGLTRTARDWLIHLAGNRWVRLLALVGGCGLCIFSGLALIPYHAGPVPPPPATPWIRGGWLLALLVGVIFLVSWARGEGSRPGIVGAVMTAAMSLAGSVILILFVLGGLALLVFGVW
jgi:hypothetical protein